MLFEAFFVQTASCYMHTSQCGIYSTYTYHCLRIGRSKAEDSQNLEKVIDKNCMFEKQEITENDEKHSNWPVQYPAAKSTQGPNQRFFYILKKSTTKTRSQFSVDVDSQYTKLKKLWWRSHLQTPIASRLWTVRSAWWATEGSYRGVWLLCDRCRSEQSRWCDLLCDLL